MLYEPTNIIPSTMTQTGTVAATTDNVNIQWQVNGNSAMTMFQIDVMQNNADSTFVYSTGIVTENPTVAQGYSLPFYGKDRFGDYVQFVYQPNQTWAAWSGNAISDGNSYKFRITQFFQENSVISKVLLTSPLNNDTTYYFADTINGTQYYIAFSVADASFFTTGTSIYFDFTHNAGWAKSGAPYNRIFTDMTFSLTTAKPQNAEGLNLQSEIVDSTDVMYNQFFTAQNSASSFITRTEPTLTITPLTETPVASATQNFTATYSQAQGDSINTVRWQLYNADDMNAPIDDTGEISTSVLSYEYNGLFDGQSYSLVCTVTTESGVSVSATLEFSVQYEQGEYTGDFTAQSLCREDANLLQWDGVSAIPGVDNPVGAATVSNGHLTLPENATVTWSQKSNQDGELQPLNISPEWSAIWKGNVKRTVASASFYYNIQADNKYFDDCVLDIAFNPSGTLMVVVGEFENHAALYSINGSTATFLQYIYGSDGKVISENGVFSAAFSPDGSILFLGGSFAESPAIYTISGKTVTFKKSLSLPSVDSSVLGSMIYCATFSPDGSVLVLGTHAPISSQIGGVCKYNINNGEIENQGELVYGAEGWQFSDLSFSPQMKILCATGGYIGTNPLSTLLFTVSDETITFSGSLENTTAALSLAFNPSGTLLAIGGSFANYAKLYSVSGTNVTYLQDITAENNSVLSGRITGVDFSPNGEYLLLGGYGNNMFTAKAYLYSVIQNNELEYISSPQNPQEPFDSYIETVCFFPNSTAFILGGYFTESASVYNITPAQYYGNKSLFSINKGNIVCSITDSKISISNQSGSIIGTISFPEQWLAIDECTICISESQIKVYSFYNEQLVGTVNSELNYSQPTISSAKLGGAQVCDYFAIIDGDGSNIEDYLSNPNFVPSWNAPQEYVVDLLANFNYGIDGGTATSTGDGFRIYRRKSDGTENIELATLPSTTISLRDYGVKSNESYIYDLYVYDANGAFMGVRSTEATPLRRQFKRFSLLSTQYSESDNCYHVVKEYQFSCNIQDMTVSNNSNKSYAQNFTPYPTVFQSTANYASGTLQSLIGFVDPKAYKYWDSTQLMDELNALSTTTNTLFLKDMKGHLWMIDVGTVQMTATQKTREMQVTISLPWTEIGDASDVSIIQTRDDEGWNDDAQVLDVKLDVDVETGLLQVVYPFPYNGTAFYLVGVTPEGVVSAVQPLPSTASQPTDGQLKAVVRHK